MGCKLRWVGRSRGMRWGSSSNWIESATRRARRHTLIGLMGRLSSWMADRGLDERALTPQVAGRSLLRSGAPADGFSRPCASWHLCRTT